MKRYCIFLILFFYSYFSYSQFNDSITKYISYASTGVINKTNDGSSYVLNNNFRFNIKKKDVSLNTAAGWIYGEQNGNLTNNDFSSVVDFNLHRTFPHFYYWGLATYDKSRSLKINDRVQAGIGIAYNLIEKKGVALNLSDGILFEKSDIFLNDTTRDVYNTFRNSFRLRYRFIIKEIIIFDGTHFIQNSLSDGKDYILKSNNSLSIKLKKWMSFTAALMYNKLNRTKRENLLITYGLTVEKYF